MKLSKHTLQTIKTLANELVRLDYGRRKRQLMEECHRVQASGGNPDEHLANVALAAARESVEARLPDAVRASMSHCAQGQDRTDRASVSPRAQETVAR